MLTWSAQGLIILALVLSFATSTKSSVLTGLVVLVVANQSRVRLSGFVVAVLVIALVAVSSTIGPPVIPLQFRLVGGAVA